MSPVQGFDPASSLGHLGTAASSWTLPLILTEPKNILIVFLIVLIILTFSNTASHIACSRAMADRKGGVKVFLQKWSRR